MTVEVDSVSGTFVVPAGVTSIFVETWGGGNRGAANVGTNGGGGSGGGGYNSATLTVAPGDSHNYIISGDTTFFDTDGTTVLVSAHHGVAASGSSGGFGGTGGVGTNPRTGGAGGGASPGASSGGGGGSSASPTAAGNNGTSGTAGTPGVGGSGSADSGAGGNGSLTAGIDGSYMGGGGGGTGSGGSVSQGAGGQVRITYAASPFGLDQEEPYVARTQSVAFTGRVFIEDEIRSSAVTLGIEEDTLSQTNKTEDVAYTGKSFIDDEISANLLYYFNLDDEGWINRGLTQSVSWLVRPYSDDEVGLFTLTVTSAQVGNYRVQNLIEGYNLWVGSGALPDLTQPPAQFSLTLPINYTLTVPGAGTVTYYVLVTKQDLYGLNSQNQYYTTVTINSAGNLVLPVLTSPQGFSLLPKANAIQVMSTYPGYGKDASPATHWRVWIGAAPPNPLVDVPTLSLTITGKLLSTTIAGYAPGTYFGAIALYRAGDASQSPALTGTVTLPSAPAEVAAVPSGFQILP